MAEWSFRPLALPLVRSKSTCEGFMDVVVIGAGPAGLGAALRAAELGARTTLVTLGDVGGMVAR